MSFVSKSTFAWSSEIPILLNAFIAEAGNCRKTWDFLDVYRKRFFDI